MKSSSLDAFWMPFSDNRQFKRDPHLMVSAEGMYYTDAEGNRLMDATAGLWCVNAGHKRKAINDAIARQLEEMDYAHSFNLGHPHAFTFANKVIEHFPAPLNKVFFTNSGSEAVDTALKIALAYHRLRGEGTRTRLIGRERSYHGMGFGGLSVAGIVNNKRAFGPLLPGVDHLRHTLSHQHNAFTRGIPSWGAHLAEDLETLVQLHGAENIAAVIVEPVQGAGGVIIPPQAYLKRLREIASQHGILLIFDEVISAFGRLGAASAAERFEVVPDMICAAKGITNATIPMGAVILDQAIYDAFMNNSDSGVELFHGYTYSGHPVACAAGMATLEIYEQEQLYQRSLALEPYWMDSALGLKDHPMLLDIRCMGLIAGIDISPDTKRPGYRGSAVRESCYRQGVLVRNAGDTLVLSPPLIVEQNEIDTIFQAIGNALDDLSK